MVGFAITVIMLTVIICATVLAWKWIEENY